MAAGFPRLKGFKKEQDRICDSFYDLGSEVTLYYILWLPLWEGGTQGHEYQEAGMIGSHTWDIVIMACPYWLITALFRVSNQHSFITYSVAEKHEW